MDYTRYVSTTTEPFQAVQYSLKKPSDGGFVYKISADGRFVDVNASLQGYSMFSGEIEHAAIGFIPWEQIEGYWEIKAGSDKKTIAEKIKDGTLEGFKENKEFNPEFKSKTGRGAVPALAGFGKDHPAYQYDYWKKFKDIPPEDAIEEIMEKVCAGNKPVVKRDNVCLKKMGYKGKTKSPSTPDQARQGKAAPEPGPDGKPSNPSESGQKKPPKKAPGSTDMGKTKMGSATEEKFLRLAEEMKEKEFVKLAEKKGLVATVENRWEKSLSEVETKALSSTKITPKLRKALGEMVNAGGKALAVAGMAVWTARVVDVFTTESTKWEQAAAVTALVPLVGCASEFGNQLNETGTDISAIQGVDVALCLVGYALLLGGVTAPLGIIVHLSRYLLQFFEPPPQLPSVQDIKSLRDKPWNYFIHKQLFTSLKDPSWRKKLEGAVALVALGVLSQGAEAIGMLEATEQVVLEGGSKES